MDKQYFIELLHKYQHGTLTGEEKKFIDTYYDVFKHEPDVLALLNPAERQQLKEEMFNVLWNTMTPQPAKIIWYKRLPRLKVAVAAAVLLLVASVVYFQNKSSTPLADIKKNELPPFAKNAVEASMPGFRNENRMIFLPDGSQVILSAGSKLNYPSSFDGMDKREVFLDGEAFFDIKHNPSRPFIVHTGNVKTVVLGTAFNVKALPGDNNIIVTVKRGKVRVSDTRKILGEIAPNQQITYNKQKVESSLVAVQNEKYLEWQHRDMIIDNLTISEAARLVEERYRVKIIVSDPEVESMRFSTIFPKDENLEQMLKSICVFNDLDYMYDRDKATVNIARKQ